MHYTNRECDVSPYRDDYAPITNVPIVQAATAYQSEYTGQTYILILNEALWMGETMTHTLVNPNQLRHYGTKVRDDPTSSTPMHIMTENNEFNIELKMKGTVIFADTHTPSAKELHDCPHIVLNSPHEWNPQSVQFRNKAQSFQDEMQQHYNVSAINCQSNDNYEQHDSKSIVFDIASINNRIINSVKIKHYDTNAISDRTISKV